MSLIDVAVVMGKPKFSGQEEGEGGPECVS